ncbi:LPD3 domain-containing protein [Burkholderia multivorans]
MAKHLHIYIHTRDAPWDESKHQRAANGQFGAGAAGGGNVAEPTTLKGDELGDFTSMKELRHKAIAYGKQFAGKKFTNNATGNQIEVTNGGIRHTVATGHDEVLRSIPALPDLLKKARLIDSQPDKRGDPNVKAVETYSAPLKLDGKSYRALITVKVFYDGHRYYNQGLVRESEK